MLDRIKSLLESRKRELTTTPGPGNRVSDHTPEDQAARIQPIVRTETGIVFPVDNVAPASDPLWLGGGFLGVSQRAEDNALSPIIHWAVVQKDA